MNLEEKYYFEQLKNAVEATFLDNNNSTTSIENWKGDEIVNFQEDLFTKVKGKVSEKWFYTYIKNTPNKLPRIDVLNLLSDYVGHKSWNTFKANQQTHKIKTKKTSKRLVLAAVLPVVIIVIYFLNRKNTFEFCFVDALKNEIVSMPIDIKILHQNQSPEHFKTDSLGCFSYETKKEIIKFVIESPYHKTDTIIRGIEAENNQIVKVKPDDYALMLHYYANGNVKDWQNHINKLELLIDDNAKIYRLFKKNINIEIYSKDEFIRMLTIPTKSLKQTEILKKEIENGKIKTLKFIVR